VKIEYVWIGGSSENSDVNFTLRSKTKVVYDKENITLKDLPNWDYDGSSTNQAPTASSEVIIIPRVLFNDPFRGENHKMVMCDNYIRSDKGELVPHATNTRVAAVNIFDKALNEKPWFGIEQEFFLMNNKTRRPLGFPEDVNHYPTEQFQYYCSCGSMNSVGRHIVDEIFDKAIEAGINVSGMNAEVAPGQWEIQVGPCTGIDSGDQVWMLRYIMERVTEKYDCHINLHAKPVSGDWNGSGCHTNYSTESMRKDGGYEVIKGAIEKLSHVHAEHIKSYGDDNHLRLTGKHETASIGTFSFGVGNRGSSIRIPVNTVAQNKGYFEDRRPSSSMNPYIVTSKLFETTVLK